MSTRCFFGAATSRRPTDAETPRAESAARLRRNQSPSRLAQKTRLDRRVPIHTCVRLWPRDTLSPKPRDFCASWRLQRIGRNHHGNLRPRHRKVRKHASTVDDFVRNAGRSLFRGRPDFFCPNFHEPRQFVFAQRESAKKSRSDKFLRRCKAAWIQQRGGSLTRERPPVLRACSCMPC